MKKTVYFVGQRVTIDDLKSSVASAVEERDKFLNNPSNNIAKIESEDIQFASGSNIVFAVIKLTYYSK
jgi:hypothetical protein